jgi:hypothetical protein
VGPLVCPYDVRVAHKDVKRTKKALFRAILTVCIILLVCDGCRSKAPGTKRRFNQFADLPSSAKFHICRDLTTEPKEEGRLSSELGNLRGYQATTTSIARSLES